MPWKEVCPMDERARFIVECLRGELTMSERLTWIYLAKDVWVSAQMARRRELPAREFLRHYLRRKKVRAVFAADDPAPAVASLGYLRSRV